MAESQGFWTVEKITGAALMMGGGGICQDHVHYKAQTKIILVETTKSQDNYCIVIAYNHCFCWHENRDQGTLLSL